MCQWHTGIFLPHPASPPRPHPARRRATPRPGRRRRPGPRARSSKGPPAQPAQRRRACRCGRRRCSPCGVGQGMQGWAGVSGQGRDRSPASRFPAPRPARPGCAPMRAHQKHLQSYPAGVSTQVACRSQVAVPRTHSLMGVVQSGPSLPAGAEMGAGAVRQGGLAGAGGRHMRRCMQRPPSLCPAPGTLGPGPHPCRARRPPRWRSSRGRGPAAPPCARRPRSPPRAAR